MGLKKILLVSDTKNWGGWTRGKYIMKYLSNEFNFKLVSADEFNEWEFNTNKKYFTIDEVKQFIPLSEDKKYIKFEDFKKHINRKKQQRNFDLYYFLFHTMLVKKSVRRLIGDGESVVTVVTGFPTVKPIFYDKKGKEEVAIRNFQNLTKRCKAIMANNQKSLRNLKTVYSGRTFYTPRGVDPDIFFPMRTEPKDEKEDFVVAYVGKPVPEKGLNGYIKQACEIAGCKLIINDRNYTDALPPEEMNKFYNKADAYIVASTIDGTPNPALEAAACGKPIISNPIGNMPEFIKQGHNGFLIKERNVNKYAYFVRKLKDDRSLAFKMGLNARDTVIKDWTWQVTCELERNMLRKLLYESERHNR